MASYQKDGKFLVVPFNQAVDARLAYAGISFRIPGIRTQELLLSGFPVPDTRDKKNNYQKISKYEGIILRLGKNFLTPHDRSFFLSE